MKKILSVFAAGIATVACAVSMTACTTQYGAMDKKTHNELNLSCYYKDKTVHFNLPVTYKWRHFAGSLAKIKSTSDKDTLYSQLKNNSSFVEEHGESLLFLSNNENNNYPQYVALSYEGINEDNSEYYDYLVNQQLAEFWGEGDDDLIRFSFPMVYAVEHDPKISLVFESDTYALKVDCTFEQLKEYYERLEYVYVSSTENFITVKGYVMKRTADETNAYKDKELLVKYNGGAVTVSLAE